jgi:hypothetical protein
LTNQTADVATATPAIPELQTPMADIIDSLKRLERIGSENSKTVEKIISAAREIEAKIVEQFEQRSDGVQIRPSSIFLRLAKEKGCSLAGAAKTLGADPELRSDYTITAAGHYTKRLMKHCGPLSDGDDESLVWIGENRDTALAFAKDLSRGLLAVIVEDLSRTQQQNDEALATLAQACESLKKPNPDDEF